MADKQDQGSGPTLFQQSVAKAVAYAVRGADINKDQSLSGSELSYAVRQTVSYLPCMYVNSVIGKANDAITKPMSEAADKAKSGLKSDKNLMDAILGEIKSQFKGKVEGMTNDDFACAMEFSAGAIRQCGKPLLKREGVSAKPDSCTATR